MQAFDPKQNTITQEQIAEIAKYDICTIADALDILSARPFNAGYLLPEIKQLLPRGRKTFVGFAATGKLCNSHPPKEEQKENMIQYYAHVQSMCRPCISVVEDIDPYPQGSIWGGINVLQHKALGCIAGITNGAIRDVYELEEHQDFGFYGTCFTTNRGHQHIVDYNCPVNVGGMTIYPGDLIAADMQGVIVIPKEVVPRLIEACQANVDGERPLVDYLTGVLERGEEIDIDELRRVRYFSGALYASVPPGVEDTRKGDGALGYDMYSK